MSFSRRNMLALPPVALAAIATDAIGQPSPDSAPAGLVTGIHRISRDTRIPGAVEMAPGAAFDIAAGATLTIAGELRAPAENIFTGPGRVDLTHSRVLAARPEWWGAAADSPAIDSLPALQACLAAHTWVQFGPGSYYISGAWTIDQPNRRIWGIGRTNEAQGTRLVRADGSGTVVLVGTEAAPPGINDYLRGIDMRWIELGRSVPAVPPAGDDAAAAAGLSIRHVLDCIFEGLRSNEHAIGYSIRGAVRTFVRDCAAFRSVATGEGNVFIGFDMDGRASAIPTGANASLYVIDCVARTGNRPRLAASVGVRMTGTFSDTFIVRFETTELDVGMLIDGRSRTLDAGRRRGGHVDLMIDAPVLDQCLSAGITITGLSDWAMIDIRSPYVALAAEGGTAIALSDSGGGITITGGQLIGLVARAAARPAIGVSLRDAQGVAIAGTKLLAFARPVDAVRASGFDLSLQVLNPERATDHPAIRLDRCRNGRLTPRITGGHAAGVTIDAASMAISIDPAGIDEHALGGPPVIVAGRAMPLPGSAVRLIGALPS